MWLNALAGLVLAVCVAAGAWRGGLATGLGIATLVLAYAASALLGSALAPAVAARLGLGSFAASVVASSLVFVVAYAVLAIAARFARRLGPRANAGRSPRDRFLGASFGALRGALLAFMLVYLALWVDALRATGAAAMLPAIGDSVAADVTSGLVETALARALDTTEPGARFVARFAARPQIAAADLQAVLDDASVAALRSDADFWGDVGDGNLDLALRRHSFQSLARDAQLRKKFAELGLVADEAAFDAEVFRQSIAQVLEEIGPRLRDLRSDPAVQELLADPAVVARIQSGDTLGLLADPRFRALVSRLSAAPPPSRDG